MSQKMASQKEEGEAEAMVVTAAPSQPEAPTNTQLQTNRFNPNSPGI